MKCSGVVVIGVAAGMLFGTRHSFAASPYAGFANGPPTDPNFFPIGVWYQNLTSSTINGYKNMNMNVYVYPDTMTQAQLDLITSAGMYTVMPQNATGVANLSNKTIIGWFNNYDEPDNAQPNGSGGYGDPIRPDVLINDYNAIKATDATRPVLLNLGQAVAWDGWYGRGTRTNHPEDYPANTTFTWTNNTVYHQGYLAGSDIGAFDFYPLNSTDSQVAGQINVVGTGVDRIRSWSAPGHPVWNYIESTDINTNDSVPGPTSTQVKAEVWLSLIHGSTGIMYFAHQFPEPPNSSHQLLDDPVMNPAVTAINAQVKSLAPVLNSDTLTSGTVVTGTASDVEVDFMTKVVGGDEYVLTVSDQNSNGPALFRDPLKAGVNATVAVLGESRSLSMVNGAFSDTYTANGVHLYEILGQTGFTPYQAPTWTSTTGGTWNDPSRWRGGVPNGSGASANLSHGITSAQTINLTNPVTLDNLFFNSPQKYTLTSSSNDNTLSIATELGSYNGSHEIQSPLVFSGTTALNVGAGAGLKISGSATGKLGSISVDTGGQLDITNKNLIVAGIGAAGDWNGSAYTGISGLIASGRNGGAWNGSGINSSVAAAAPRLLTTLGVATASDISFGTRTFAAQSVAGTDTLIMYTYAGDADLNGSVTGDDYFRIDSGFTNHLTGYENGDFDYNGRIDADDYFLIDENYSRQGGAFSPAAPIPQAIATLPEPATIALCALGITMLVRRRRHRM